VYSIVWASYSGDWEAEVDISLVHSKLTTWEKMYDSSILDKSDAWEEFIDICRAQTCPRPIVSIWAFKPGLMC
jgi:hypothetical protein